MSTLFGTGKLRLEQAFPPSKALFCILAADINELYKHNTPFSHGYLPYLPQVATLKFSNFK